MHPSPGRPEADCRAGHEQRSRETDPGLKGPIEPPAKEKTEQRRNNDRPAENADLAEPRAERRLGIGATLGAALDGSLRSQCQAIGAGSVQDLAPRSIGAAGAG